MFSFFCYVIGCVFVCFLCLDDDDDDDDDGDGDDDDDGDGDGDDDDVYSHI